MITLRERRKEKKKVPFAVLLLSNEKSKERPRSKIMTLLAKRGEERPASRFWDPDARTSRKNQEKKKDVPLFFPALLLRRKKGRKKKRYQKRLRSWPIQKRTSRYARERKGVGENPVRAWLPRHEGRKGDRTCWGGKGLTQVRSWGSG